MRGWITYPFTNFNGCTVEVWERISNFIPHFTGHVITYPRWDKINSVLCTLDYCIGSEWLYDLLMYIYWTTQHRKYLNGDALLQWNLLFPNELCPYRIYMTFIKLSGSIGDCAPYLMHTPGSSGSSSSLGGPSKTAHFYARWSSIAYSAVEMPVKLLSVRITNLLS